MAFSDAQLVARIISGDDSAFDELVSRYRSRVYYLALSKVRAREVALDVAQDAFVQAYISLRTLRDPKKFASWLTSITSNLCLMHLRRAREVMMPVEALDILNSRPGGMGETDIDAAVARSALDKLPEGTRAAAILYFVEEMKQAEIAEFLSISVSAVKSRVRDARTRLQKEMIDMVKHAAKKSKPDDDFNKSLRHKLELAKWYRELADLFENGVAILSAFDALREAEFSDTVKQATAKLRDAVASGKTMSDALEELPALTTSQAVGMVRAGEVGGILDWTARFLADWIEIENGQRELELSFWCRTIGSVIAGGAPIKLALECSFDIVRSKELKQTARDLVKAIDSGEPLEPVLVKHADALLPIVQVAILAGEKAGILGYTLQWAANQAHAGMSLRLFGREFRPPISQADWVRAFAWATDAYVDSKSAATRAAAATILGRLVATEKAGRVMKLLSDQDMEVRKAAIYALSDMGCNTASAELVRCLDDGEPSVRRAAIDAITSMKLHDLAPAVAEAIADPDQRVANTTIKALEAMEEIDVLVKRAIQLLAHERSICRVRAAQILLGHPTPKAADALVRALDDEVLNVAYTSALALAQLGRKEAVPTLLKALEYPHLSYFQRQAAEALAEIGDPSAAPHIRKAIEEGRLDPTYAWTAEKLKGKRE